MKREELIEQRKGMANDEVIKAVIGKMVERYCGIHQELMAQYRSGKRDGWSAEALNDLMMDMHNVMIKSVVLEDLLATLDERCSAYVNGIEY